MSNATTQEVIDYLRDYTTEERVNLYNKILDQRTDHLSVVMEDFKHAHNYSALLRTADSFGIQDVHAIEKIVYMQDNRKITRGSNKWLTLHQYDGEGDDITLNCIKNLKATGYKIAVTTPHEKSYSPTTLPLDEKVAIWMGSEAWGASSIAMDHADYFLKIPMDGFSESLNVSVAAAIIMHSLKNRVKTEVKDWNLSQERKNEILLHWMKINIPMGEKIVGRYLSER